MEFIINDEGYWEEYDDTYDVVIHCDSEESRNELIELLESLDFGKE